MPKYSYTAVNASGKEQKGTIVAASPEEATELLKKQQLFITSLKDPEAKKRAAAKKGGKGGGMGAITIGTPVIKAIELADGVLCEPGKLILGGPMMGFAQRSFEIPVAKNTSGILLLPPRVSMNFRPTECIRCGRCVQGCPMHLMPCAIAAAVESYRFDLAKKHHVMDCLECGACAYVCPAKRPLVQHNRRAKAEIRRQTAKK